MYGLCLVGGGEIWITLRFWWLAALKKIILANKQNIMQTSTENFTFGKTPETLQLAKAEGGGREGVGKSP